MKWVRQRNCVMVQERLGDYIEGGLSVEERDRVEQHLVDCTACGTAVDLERRLADLKGHIGPCPVPEGFAASVLAKRRDQGYVRVYWRSIAFGWTAFSSFAFRVFCDPLLGAKLKVRDGLDIALQAVITPLATVRVGLIAEVEKIYAQVAAPLKPAYKQVSLWFSD